MKEHHILKTQGMRRLEPLSAGMAGIKAPLADQCSRARSRGKRSLGVKIPPALLVKPTPGILRPQSKDANRLHAAEYELHHQEEAEAMFSPVTSGEISTSPALGR